MIDIECATHVISDPNRFRQILQNLLSNAAKFTSSGSISLSIKPVSSDGNVANVDDENMAQLQVQRLRFEVTDTGIGITPGEQSHVFERYKQANASVARNFGGTGLGLPICKELIELLGGSIGLHSEYNVGTTVYFELPFRVAPNVNSRTDEKAEIDTISLPEEICAMNILVVEDNIVNQKVVKAMLQRLGHNVTLAENGKVALHEISQQQFNVILMDIQMPVMDGIECTKYIRNELQCSKEELPILGLTAGYQNSDLEYYVNEVGMNGCLGKPLPMEKLKQAIAAYSKKSK
jgi:CheY-like chemotaxis protein